MVSKKKKSTILYTCAKNIQHSTYLFGLIYNVNHRLLVLCKLRIFLTNIYATKKWNQVS